MTALFSVLKKAHNNNAFSVFCLSHCSNRRVGVSISNVKQQSLEKKLGMAVCKLCARLNLRGFGHFDVHVIFAGQRASHSVYSHTQRKYCHISLCALRGKDSHHV